MRALTQRRGPIRYVGSGDGGTIEQRRRLARPALEILGDRGRNRRRRFCDGGQVGRNRGQAKQGAARSLRDFAVLLMLAVGCIGVVLMPRAMLVRGGGRYLGRQAGRSIAERQRNARREHAKQIEQGRKPPSFGAHRPRQANEHGGNLTPAADFAKAKNSGDSA